MVDNEYITFLIIRILKLMADLDTYRIELDGAINSGEPKSIGSSLILRAAIANIQQTSGSATAPVVVTSVAETNPPVTATSSTILAANPNRKDALIINTGTVDIFLSRGGTAVAGRGIVLKAGGSAYEINGSNLYKGAINAIASSSASLLVSEGV